MYKDCTFFSRETCQNGLSLKQLWLEKTTRENRNILQSLAIPKAIKHMQKEVRIWVRMMKVWYFELLPDLLPDQCVQSRMPRTYRDLPPPHAHIQCSIMSPRWYSKPPGPRFLEHFIAEIIPQKVGEHVETPLACQFSPFKGEGSTPGSSK